MKTLKEARLEKKITQKDLGDMIGKSTQTIRDYEAGNYNIPGDVKAEIVSLLGEFEVKTGASVKMPIGFKSGKKEGERTLKEARLEAGLSQKKLAERIGVSTQSIINYEKGAHGISEPAREKIEEVIGKFDPTN